MCPERGGRFCNRTWKSRLDSVQARHGQPRRQMNRVSVYTQTAPTCAISWPCPFYFNCLTILPRPFGGEDAAYSGTCVRSAGAELRSEGSGAPHNRPRYSAPCGSEQRCRPPDVTQTGAMTTSPRLGDVDTAEVEPGHQPRLCGEGSAR